MTPFLLSLLAASVSEAAHVRFARARHHAREAAMHVGCRLLAWAMAQPTAEEMGRGVSARETPGGARVDVAVCGYYAPFNATDASCYTCGGAAKDHAAGTHVGAAREVCDSRSWFDKGRGAFSQWCCNDAGHACPHDNGLDGDDRLTWTTERSKDDPERVGAPPCTPADHDIFAGRGHLRCGVCGEALTPVLIHHSTDDDFSDGIPESVAPTACGLNFIGSGARKWSRDVARVTCGECLRVLGERAAEDRRAS